MLNRWLLAAALAATSFPLFPVEMAAAYPTSVWNVPTGNVTDAGNLHVGIYTYSSAGREVSIQDGLTFGALPGLELFGVPGIGALEVGVDTYGSAEAFNAKLQLFGETLWVPGVAVGGLNLASTSGPSENLVYAALTKETGPEDMSSGSWTIGYFTTRPDDPEATPESGLMGGVTLPLGGGLSVTGDFLLGATSVSGGNVLLNYQVVDSALLSLGYYIHPSDSSANLFFIGADIDVPTGLFGDSSAGQDN